MGIETEHRMVHRRLLVVVLSLVPLDGLQQEPLVELEKGRQPELGHRRERLKQRVPLEVELVEAVYLHD